jgi:hypothetical protein
LRRGVPSVPRQDQFVARFPGSLDGPQSVRNNPTVTSPPFPVDYLLALRPKRGPRGVQRAIAENWLLSQGWRPTTRHRVDWRHPDYHGPNAEFRRALYLAATFAAAAHLRTIGWTCPHTLESPMDEPRCRPPLSPAPISLIDAAVDLGWFAVVN